MKAGFGRKETKEGTFVDVPAGKIQMGVATDSSCGFVWDNEGPPKVRASTCA